MKGLSGSRSHHHGVTCDSACDSLSHHSDRKPYLLSPVEHHPADHPYYTQRNSFQAECVGPFSDPLASSTFPRRHYNSQQELKDECALVPRTLATKVNRIPPNLLDQFERQLPLNRDGYHTLQYKRTAMEHRSDSPGRIRHLVHSVQKLFTKSHSLEGPSKGSVNGGKASPDETQTMRYGKRSKSKERRAEPKARPNTSPGWWSSDDNLDGDMCIYHAPSGVMTMGRCPDRSASQYFMETYNTISEQAVKASRSNNDVKCSTCANLPVNLDAPLLKKSAWSSTLTVSRAREVYQKASVNMDQAMVKSESCQQERSCQYLQVPQDEWTGYTPRGKDDEIPCRRMRSGSYIKAMGDEDSGDSDTSPKPSPKVAARRESYLKATQPSLTELTTLKHDSGRLLIDVNFEASGAPVHKLVAALGLNDGDGSNDIIGNHVPMVLQAASHVFTMVSISWKFNIEISITDVIDSFIVNHDGTIRVLQGSMSSEDGVVGLNYGFGILGDWVNGELQLRLLAIINRETFHQQGGESGTSSPTKAMENQEALKTYALVSQLLNLIQDKVKDLLAKA
ncbi:Disks large-associated protein 1 [Pteropus alecto]|uniref:Disks large-associated protein 1 n=1 Tax=Pteropus alecto TaxID=9402 RepID=L5K205_PTEAL|nr:Disks large-associated protein 1 [Pteropus alecto]